MTQRNDIQNAARAVTEATRIQRRAATPTCSVALRASAGSGKTKVLVDRFLRLCIESVGRPAHPRSILAVTFTRKAAVEIQERLLQRTAKMALAAPEDLRALLTDLFADRTDPRPSAPEMQRAARLYEQVLEDVSGLNVGTIHSFCQTILNRFAVEAGLDPKFAVIEDAQELVDEALDLLETEIARGGDTAAAASETADTPTAVRLAVRSFFHQQMRVQRWIDRLTGLSEDPALRPPRNEVLPEMLRELRELLFPESPRNEQPALADLLPALADALNEFRTAGTDRIEREIGAEAAAALAKDLQKLRAAAGPIRATDESAFASVHQLLLTQAGKLKAFTRKRDEVLKDALNEAVGRHAMPLLDVLRRAKYIELYLRNRGLLRLGLRALDLYDDLKRRDRVVDFQDLEDLARRLMGDDARALSLLYRLDDSITHILLDEFQDTNFNQWEILRPFVEEFLAGGDEERQPTVFFVGDVKQSIYEFRGAEPDLFARVENLLTEREQPVLSLPTNFRSLGAVVSGVGCLFRRAPLVEYLEPSEHENVAQQWARTEAPGENFALPPCEEGASETEDAGRSVDEMAAAQAARIARHLVDSGETTWEGFGAELRERPLGWSDVLVLCRTRTEIAVYEKAFQEAGIPVAPSGRGMLAASREVQDLLALLRWLVFPADDAALATVLRSPLFRLSEQEFQETLARRGLDRRDEQGEKLPPRGLWQTLSADENHEVTGEPVKRLKIWRRNLGFVSCHDLLRRIYREGEVLERYQAARGDQARYNLLRLFDLAQSSELALSPTMRRLIEMIDGAGRRGGQDEGSLPRGSDQGRVRFMTIHGAKGLESPVVLLVDADRPGDKEGGRIRTDPIHPNTPLLFGLRKEHRHPFQLPAGLAMPEDRLLAAARIARERGRREEAHLMYVALTRARDRLYVLGGNKEPKSGRDDFESPLRRIRQGATGCDAVQTEAPQWLQSQAVAPGNPLDTREPAVAYRIWQPPVQRERLKEVTPSSAGGEDAAAEKATQTAAQRTLFDAAAETLPPTVRGEEIHALLQLAADQGAMPPGDDSLHAEAAAVFADPAWGWIFAPDGNGLRGRSEVPLIHARPGTGIPQRITGIIDRLVFRPGRVDIVDYKTNRTGGDRARRDHWCDHYAPQLALYREAISAQYPDREVGTWLLFTDPKLKSSERLVEIPPKGTKA